MSIRGFPKELNLFQLEGGGGEWGAWRMKGDAAEGGREYARGLAGQVWVAGHLSR